MIKRLLIIEDDETFAGGLVRALSRRGYSCMVGNDQDSALQLCDSFCPSHILLDLHLNEESGQALVLPIRQKLPYCHLVILTGYGSIPSTVQAMREGASYYLCKPATPEAIEEALDTTSAQISHSLHDLQESHIQQVLKQCEGNISKTARVLGIDRRTLQRKLKNFL